MVEKINQNTYLVMGVRTYVVDHIDKVLNACFAQNSPYRHKFENELRCNSQAMQPIICGTTEMTFQAAKINNLYAYRFVVGRHPAWSWVKQLTTYLNLYRL